MTSNINLIAFGTFGNPNGFKQTFFSGNNDLAKSIKTFDLNTNAIKLFPNSKLYSIRKEYAGGFNTIAYSIYTYAKEKSSDRSGTFIGSSILFTNKITEEDITIGLLNECQEYLTNKNVQNDIISVNHSDNFSVMKPKDFDKVEESLKPVEDLNFMQSSNKNLVVFAETSPDKLQIFFKKSIDLLNVYDTIYFTNSREIAEFVNQKGIFRLIQNAGDKRDFEQEIINLQEERKQKVELLISEYKNEIIRLEDDKSKTLSDFKGQIEKNEKDHQENEKRIKESKIDLKNVENIYEDYSSKIQDLVNLLKSGTKLDEAKQIHNRNKNLFIDGISHRKKPIFINSISKVDTKSGLTPEISFPTLEHYGQSQHHNKSKEKSDKNVIGYFKVVILALLLLLIGSWLYFLFVSTKEDLQAAQIKQQLIPIEPESVQVQVTNSLVEELKPKPNTELDENDYRLVANQLKYNIMADDIVKIIFNKNPTDIKDNYTGQEKLYIKLIVELNKNCFEKNSIFYFTKDTLRHIPSYKKGN